MSADTKPYVFIIESNQWEDEQEERREGMILKETLSLCQKTVEYRYIRTEKEFKFVLQQFEESKFRYLHISCHGYGKGFAFTLDRIPFRDFAELTSPFLGDRRLFISACDCVKPQLAKPILLNTSCYSVIGPGGNILFSDSAMIWASFYSLIFKEKREVMKAAQIKEKLFKVCSLFRVGFNAYFRKNRPPYYEYKLLGHKDIHFIINR
jgi:hypothetical protein